MKKVKSFTKSEKYRYISITLKNEKKHFVKVFTNDVFCIYTSHQHAIPDATRRIHNRITGSTRSGIHCVGLGYPPIKDPDAITGFTRYCLGDYFSDEIRV